MHHHKPNPAVDRSLAAGRPDAEIALDTPAGKRSGPPGSRKSREPGNQMLRPTVYQPAGGQYQRPIDFSR